MRPQGEEEGAAEDGRSCRDVGGRGVDRLAGPDDARTEAELDEDKQPQHAGGPDEPDVPAAVRAVDRPDHRDGHRERSQAVGEVHGDARVAQGRHQPPEREREVRDGKSRVEVAHQRAQQELHVHGGSGRDGGHAHASRVVLGALASGSTDELARKALLQYARAIGLAFQVQDDILDVESDTATLGKTQGKDEAHDKPTYPALLGLDNAKGYALDLRDQALHVLRPFGNSAEPLRELARYIVERRS